MGEGHVGTPEYNLTKTSGREEEASALHICVCGASGCGRGVHPSLCVGRQVTVLRELDKEEVT